MERTTLQNYLKDVSGMEMEFWGKIKKEQMIPSFS